MRGRRVQTSAALALTALGAVLLAAGPAGVRHIADLVGAYSGYLLLAAAFVLAAVIALPRGTRTGPLVLGVMGLVILCFQHGTTWYENRWAIIGLLCLAAGGALTAKSPAPGAVVEMPPILRATTFLLPRTYHFSATEKTPPAFRLTAIAGSLHADLVDLQLPRRNGVEIFITCWAGGHVKLALPANWPVYAGRMTAVTAIRCAPKFEFSDAQYFEDPQGEHGDDLLALAQAFNARPEQVNPTAKPVWALIHIAGFAGTVDIERG